MAEELMARLGTIGASRVFDLETLPERHTAGITPHLVIQDISEVPDASIDSAIIGRESRWQVSVRGTKLSSVRFMAQAVSTSLHGFTSDNIKHCAYESWPGTIREPGNPTEFHAPVDFIVQS